MSKGYIRRHWQRYNTFADGKITQYMHQIGCIYLVVPQQKWNNIYLETIYKLEGGILQTSALKIKSERELEFLSSFK